MALDYEYGVSIDPQPNARGFAVYEWEANFTPISLSVLDQISGGQLRVFMQKTLERWLVGNVLINDVIIIWAVKPNGEIVFAIEEMFFEGTPTGRPKFQSFPLTANSPKLGHPSLVAAGKARIAGEIYLDTQNTMPQWIINNYSGRYGAHSSRKFAHLRNVAKRFRAFGIELRETFRV